MPKRQTPRRHTVHTQDSRYNVPQYGRGSKSVRTGQVPELSIEDELKQLEAQMWDNYDEQIKLREREEALPYGSPEKVLLLSKINDLIRARSRLNQEFSKLKREGKNAALKSHGFKEGDRVYYTSQSPFHMAYDETFEGRVVMRRGRMMVELDRPVNGKKYTALGRAWRRESNA